MTTMAGAVACGDGSGDDLWEPGATLMIGGTTTGDPDTTGGIDEDTTGSGGVEGSSAGSGTLPDPDMGPQPPPFPPMPVEPCEMGSCWSTLTFSGYCGSTEIAENFSSGSFNVHELALSVRAGIDADLTLTRTGGDFEPALVIHDASGETVYDGEVGIWNDDLIIETVDTGMASDTASVLIRPQIDLSLSVFVTGWSVIDGGFATPLPTDATYTYEVFQDCPKDTGSDVPPNFDPANVVGGYYLLPDSEPPGLYTHKDPRCSRGTQRLVEVLYTVASRWAEIRPEYTPISILDMNEAWCSTVDHATHDDGTHADLTVSCATEVACPDWIPAYDLARLFVDTGEVCGIIFNDTVVQDVTNPYFAANHAYEPWNGGFMRTVSGHESHFHVRVKKPDGTCN